MVEIQFYATNVASDVPIEIYWGLLGLFVVGLLILIWWKGLRRGLRYGTGTDAERGYNLIPFWSYWDYGEQSYFMEMFGENILNVLLFVPIGFLAGCGLERMTFKKVLFFGGGLSVFIELLQFIFKKGFCETDDVIHNVLGCMIGYGLWRVCCIRLHTS